MKKRKPLKVVVGDLRCVLTRLDDQRYIQLAESSLAIREDHGFLMDLLLQERRRGTLLNLAEIYAAFKSSFGESGNCFDDYKGAFSFPFEVAVYKDESIFLYLLNVVNWRSTIEFHFRKVISPDDRSLDRMVIHPPIPAEFSTEEMNKVVAFLYGYAEGAIGILRHFQEEEFVKKVDSNLVLFGYRDGHFFQEHYEDNDVFLAAWETMKVDTAHCARVSDAAADLRRGLYDRFGTIPKWVEPWIANAQEGQLDAWMRRLPDAHNLASVFAPVV